MHIGMACLCLGIGIAAIAAAEEPDSFLVVPSLPEAGRGAYEHFWDVPEVLSRPGPAYPESAWIAGIEGRVLVRILIDTTGTVAEAHPEGGPSLFHAAALEAVRKWTFDPARDQGRPIRVWMPVPFQFRLEELLPPGDSSVVSLADRAPTRRTPFGCLPGATGADPARRDVAQALVDARGRVRNVRFARPAPADSVIVRKSILSWTFPGVPAGATSAVDRAADAWIRIPIVRTCPQSTQPAKR